MHSHNIQLEPIPEAARSERSKHRAKKTRAEAIAAELDDKPTHAQQTAETPRARRARLRAERKEKGPLMLLLVAELYLKDSVKLMSLMLLLVAGFFIDNVIIIIIT